MYLIVKGRTQGLHHELKERTTKSYDFKSFRQFEPMHYQRRSFSINTIFLQDTALFLAVKSSVTNRSELGGLKNTNL